MSLCLSTRPTVGAGVNKLINKDMLTAVYVNQPISQYSACLALVILLARDVIYTSRAYAMISVSVCLSVTEVHWHIIANLGFNSDPNLPRIVVAVHAGASTKLFIVQWA